MRRTTVFLEPGLLASLFNAWDLWTKIHDGRLSIVTARSSSARTSGQAGDTQILKHYTSSNMHVCTTHRIIDAEGTILHWDESNLNVAGLTLVKRPRGYQPA